jgi:hypothetical protein
MLQLILHTHMGPPEQEQQPAVQRGDTNRECLVASGSGVILLLACLARCSCHAAQQRQGPSCGAVIGLLHSMAYLSNSWCAAVC